MGFKLQWSEWNLNNTKRSVQHYTTDQTWEVSHFDIQASGKKKWNIKNITI